MATADRFADAGLRIAQEVVWEKQNGTGFPGDRFKRVHELAVQFYPAETAWRDIYNDVQTTPDATARTVRRKQRPPHTGQIDGQAITSAMTAARASCVRSSTCAIATAAPSVRPKPSALLEILIRTSCPEGGLVGDWFAGSGAAGEACRLSEQALSRLRDRQPAIADLARARIATVLPFHDGAPS